MGSNCHFQERFPCWTSSSHQIQHGREHWWSLWQQHEGRLSVRTHFFSSWELPLFPWPLYIHPQSLSVLLRLLLIWKHKATAQGNPDVPECLKVWERFVGTLKQNALQGTLPSDTEDLNVEHLQLLLLIFHNFSERGRRSIMMLCIQTIVELKANMETQQCSVPLIVAWLLLVFDYLLHQYSKAPMYLFEQVDSYDVHVEEDLGEIQLIKIEKRKYWYQDDWYLKYVTVKTPVGDYLEFPCYRWITDEKEIVLRDGRAKLLRDDKTQILKQHRRKELESRQKMYRWKEWHPGFPLSIDAHCHSELPRDIQFDSEKGIDFILNYTKAMENLYINRFMHMFQSSWSDFADFERIFVRISNTISEYVMQHWKEDFMFGYQFLNGCNPVLIRRCTEIPKKLPVTMDMVECSLERNLTLEEEVKQGNIFIVDYELLDGVDANKTDPCTIQYLAAPICLLYKNLENKIVPIAIQLGQKPGPDNPIFLPSDATYDWLLAKIWVRSSDFHIHQTVTHLLRTHLVSEVFSIAMFRQLPAVHPLFKLLVPHMRFTIAINTKAREQLICECGLFDKANATGGGGHVQMVQKAMKDLTYSSLCFPEEIKAKGMDSKEDIPYYYYRDDGINVWEAIKSFAEDVIHIYYESDEVVCEDVELQAFVKDIYVYGMRGVKASGFPKMIRTRETLAEYLTVIIFTASAQHAAVNFGQYDWCSWIPNAPPTMRCPPPTEKGTVTIEQIVESLPDRGRSCWHLGAVWALSQFQDKELFLGMYPDEHFVEKPVKEAMAKFRKNLDEIVNIITERNKNKKLPYYYLSPDRIPNSVAV